MTEEIDPNSTSSPIVEITQDYHCTDLGNAKRLVVYFKDVMRYCPARKTWLFWNNKRWEWDLDGSIDRAAKVTVRSIYTEVSVEQNDDRRKKLSSWARISASAPRIEAMIKLARSEPGIPILASMLDADPMLLGVKNGTIDLRTGEFRESRPEDFIEVPDIIICFSHLDGSSP